MQGNGAGPHKWWFSTLQDVTDQVRAEEERRESDRRFRDMMSMVQLISVMLDPEARITYCNDYMLKLTGWTREQVLGRSWFEVFIPPDADWLHGTFTDLIVDRPSAWHVESEILTRAGDRRMVRWNNSVLRSASGDIIGTASLGEDITAQRTAQEQVRRLNADLEQRVAERTAQLEAANRELESYDYSISHDLRAPLNRVRGFSAALLEDHGGKLDGEAAEHLKRIVASADSMGQMVSDILRLSNLSRAELHRSRVDLAELARTILAAHALAYPERTVQWRIGSGLHAHADPGLVRVALENLLANAWKFTGNRADAVIEVASRDEAGETVYTVRDNGAGFDLGEGEKLFMPFQRLRSSGDFPGSGVGLATVKRIVQRHGGRVWAEARPGEGAAFHFTLQPRDGEPGT
jgi:PAS domain S-box-containing protein